MKKLTVLLSAAALLFSMAAFSQSADKYISSKSHIKFFSTTPVEDIEANNYASVSTINPKTGDVVFSVPMQSFEFEKALMQKHYNSAKFLDTQKFPKAKYKGKITNLSDINFDKDGTYQAVIEGEMTIKGETEPSKQTGTITVTGGEIHVTAKTTITLADFGVGFEKGKPAKNIAKTIDVTVDAKYKK